MINPIKYRHAWCALAIVVAAAMLFPYQASATLCESISVKQAYENADIVFVGILAAKNTEEVSGERTVLMPTTSKPVKRKYVYYKTELRFEPIKIWKGNEEQTQTIVYIDASEKNQPFVRHRNYLIFANLNKDNNAFEIRYCSPWSDIGHGSSYSATFILDQLSNKNVNQLDGLDANNVTISKGIGFPDHVIKRMQDEQNQFNPLWQLREQMQKQEGKQ